MRQERKKASAGLRPPKPLFERVKIPLILLAYIGLSEWADPFPFNVSLPARLAVALFLLFALREFHHARLEVDTDWAARAARVESGLRERASRVSRHTWLRVQRAALWVLGVYAFGTVLNMLTDRCDGAVQCAVLSPRMAIENLPQFLQFAVFVSLTLFQLAIMFYAMVKVGSFKLVMPGTVGVTFDDVWGQDEAKRKVMEQVQLLEDSEEVEAAGGHMPKGLLLWGPPGTGKTYLAKAAANYSSKPLILVPPGAFQATFVGINLLKVWMLFRTVRKLARRYGGVIVFIDEIDSLGSRGGGVSEARPVTWSPGCVPFRATEEPRPIVVDGSGGGMGTLEAFLSAMDGMEEPRGLLNRVLVFAGFKPLRPYDYKYLMMGATNMMERLDPALLRAGRFGRKIHVTYPKVDGRRRTYEGYLGRVSHDLSAADVEWAARNHARGTGAEIKDIVNEALLITFRDDRNNPGLIRFNDLMRAMMWVKFGESEKPFERDKARWAVSVHEAGHAVAFHALVRDRASIWFATIEKHGETGGMVVPTARYDDDWLDTREELIAELQISLASRVAEEMLLDTTTSGHGGDGRHATETAVKMVNYGHVEGLANHFVLGLDNRELRSQVEKVLHEALDACRETLNARRSGLEAVARLLYERGTVPGDEIHRALDAAS